MPSFTSQRKALVADSELRESICPNIGKRSLSKATSDWQTEWQPISKRFLVLAGQGCGVFKRTEPTPSALSPCKGGDKGTRLVLRLSGQARDKDGQRNNLMRLNAACGRNRDKLWTSWNEVPRDLMTAPAVRLKSLHPFHGKVLKPHNDWLYLGRPCESLESHLARGSAAIDQ